MARYIDVDEFFKHFSCTSCADDIIEYLQEAPTADVVEVKHGEWKKVECGTICTNCNRVYDNDFEFLYKQIKEYFKRCPECGAIMRGGEK